MTDEISCGHMELNKKSARMKFNVYTIKSKYILIKKRISLIYT